MSDGRMSFPALDQLDFGRGLPRMLMALRMMVSPALTVSPSFIVGSRTMVGASAKETKTNIVIRKGRWLNILFFF